MGGCCIRFETLEDAALDVIGEAARRMPAKAYVENCIEALARTGHGPDGKRFKIDTIVKQTAKPYGKPSVAKVSKKSKKKVAKKAGEKVTGKPVKR